MIKSWPYHWRMRKSQRKVRWLLFMLLTMGWWLVAAKGPVLIRLLGVAGGAWLVLHARAGSRIPVLTFHSVSDRGRWLCQPDLTVTTASFEAQLQWLRKRGFRTLTLDELLNCRSRGTHCGKAVALTFDDGYLDAWVAVAPLLKRYGHKGTVFVSSGWIEDGEVPRPRMGQNDHRTLQWEGYLNRAEVRCLKREGILDVQSHADSHDRIYAGPHIDDFVTQNPPPLWVYLLHHPEARVRWYQNERRLPLGRPIFQGAEALAAAAFHPHPEFCHRLQTLAGRNTHLPGNELRNLLSRQAKHWIDNGQTPGRLEDAEETLARWKRELQTSKQVLERISAGRIDHFCWPRSAWQPDSEALALEAGYRSTTNGNGHNGTRKPWRVSRVHVGGIGRTTIDLWRFILEIQVFRGHYGLWPFLWLLQQAMGRVWRIEKRRLS